ncbi:hypothetical protein JKP75_03565 [Blastococcus sp. TML/M2B]|uniref:hypothetical protein n=1 Tax=unclassified Blastococcus TaxID=2619396 RepID=UPI001909516A|nr:MULTISPECIES: hypothetical protein [unclassified Blastococcus]MBN1091727.1 hypothetical protein [Blastococcus sp. TML/M2B]MBN1094712.1 hypothetical protein [Blastococcus sp. TML/C7B]
MSIPEASMSTWPCGSRSTANTSAGVAGIRRAASIRSAAGSSGAGTALALVMRRSMAPT